MNPHPGSIALFGGSFDPVHLGHRLVAQAAHEEIGVEKVIFIPAAQSPFKPDRILADGRVRLQLLRLALAGCAYAEVDPIELERGGVSYTIDTVKAFQEKNPGSRLFYLIGADHISQLPLWRSADELAGMIQFVVIPRPGEPPASVPEPFRCRFLKGFPLGVSSSQIRARIKAGLPVDWLTGSRVAEAVRNNHLYL